MAIAFVRSAQGGTGGTGGTTSTNAEVLTAGNLLVVCVRAGIGTIDSVADTAGNTFIPLPGVGGVGYAFLRIFYAKNVIGHATNVVTATHSSGGTEYRSIVTAEFSGVNLVLDAAVGGISTAGSTTISSPNLTTAVPATAVVAFASQDGPSTFTAGAGYTLIDGTMGSGGLDFFGAEYKIAAGVISNVAQTIVSNTSLNSSMVVAAFREAVSTVLIGHHPAADYTGDMADTYLAQGAPDGTRDTENDMVMAKLEPGSWIHSVVQFRWPAPLPDNISISAVAFTMTMFNGSGPNPLTISVKRILRPAVISQMTWNSYSTSNAWTTPGGTSDGNDRAASPSVDLAVNLSNGNKTWDLTPFADLIEAAALADSTIAFHFEYTSGADDGGRRDFLTSNYSGDTTLRPYLAITFEEVAPPSLLMMGQSSL